MLHRVRDSNILLIYGAVLLLGTAYGISISVIALHLDARGFSKSDIGHLAAIFACGIVATSLPAGALLRRFSAKTILTLSLSAYAFTVGIFPLLHSYGAIAFARFFDGAFSVAVWVSCETMLLMRSDEDNKAHVTSLYGVAMASGYVIGPLVARPIAHALSIEAPFFFAAGLAALSALAVLWRLDGDAPRARSLEWDCAQAREAPPPTSSSSRAMHVVAHIKTSCFATFAYGYFQSSVVLFLPLFLVESKGISREGTILLPAFFAGGMLLFSNAAGRVGDRVGHLLLMRVLGAVGAATIVAFVFLNSFGAMAVAVFAAGATLASISPLSLALQGLVVPKDEYGRANAMYNACYAMGMVLGPPTSSALFRLCGGATMLYHLAALWVAFVVFAAVFASDDPVHVRDAGGHARALRGRVPGARSHGSKRYPWAA